MANDLDQAVSNAIAGGVSFPVDAIAWLLRKGGLPIDKPVMGSDWMKEKGLTKEVQGNAPAQVVGETIGSLADPLAPLSKVALAAKAAHAALYAGALRKDLLASTAVDPAALLRHGEVTSELTSPSMAVRPGAISDFNGGPLTLIAKEGRFDPRTSNTALHAFDAYAPRRNQTAAKTSRQFEAERAMLELKYERHPRLLAIALQELLRDQAGRRLADRFLPLFEKGGRQGESMGVPTARGLPEYGKGGFDSPLQPIAPTNPGFMGASYGPRFQSFKHFETSPYGAARLDDGTDVYEVYDKIRQQFGHNAKGKYLGDDQDAILEEMWTAAQGHRGLGLEKQAHELYNLLKRTKSDYAELKAFGPVGLHRENFPGAIIRNPGNQAAERVGDMLRKRGIQVHATSDPAEQFDIANWMAKGGSVNPLRTTAPTKQVKPPVEPKLPIESKIPVGEVTELGALEPVLAWTDHFKAMSPKNQGIAAAAFEGKPGLATFIAKINDPKVQLSDLTDEELDLVVKHGISSYALDVFNADIPF